MPPAPTRDPLRAPLSNRTPAPRRRRSALTDPGWLLALLWLTACTTPNGNGSPPPKADTPGELPPAQATAAAPPPTHAPQSPAPSAASTTSAADAANAAGAASAASAANAASTASAASAASTAGAANAASTASAGSAAPPAVERPSCPADMAPVGDFCIDRYEAHLVTGDGDALAVHPYFQRPEPGVRYLARSAAGVFPQAYISRVEAEAACVAAGKRLCTRREWMRACRGQGVHRYPYGPRGERGRCNTGKPHLLREVFGDHPPGGWSYEKHFNSPDLDQTPGFLARSGDYAGCASELGVHDMVGNLHEWVSDKVDRALVQRMELENTTRREQPWHEGNGVFMGGFFSTTSELGSGCYFTTIAHEPTYHDYSTGFRCCATPAGR